MSIRIYHNEDCSKSCSTLEQLKPRFPQLEIINYVINPPSKEELKFLINMLGIKPIELIRKNEPEFEAFKNKKLTAEECISLMARYPALIQRPVVVKDGRAFIVRPPLSVSDIL